MYVSAAGAFMYATRRVATRANFGDGSGVLRARQGPYLLGDTQGAARRVLAREPGLGSLTSIIGGLIGGAIGGPAGAAAGTSIGSLTSFTGSQDQQRQQRVNWMLQAAQAGSTLAAAIIYAGPHNVASHETAMWQQAWSAVPVAVQNAALGQYPNGFWPTGAPFDMPTQRAQIVSQLQSLGVPASNNPTSPVTGPSGLPIQPIPGTGGYATPPLSTGPTLPGMTTFAGYNWLPVMLIGGAAVIALTQTKKRGRR